MDFLTNFWVVLIIVFAFLFGNIAAFRYADKLNVGRHIKGYKKKYVPQESDIEKKESSSPADSDQ
ncbi:DUF2897 family protein [Aliivibrio kagoshimensis]|uniref:DUF2897 family protein n=1 Tax=Aliivibrio kagoshimensis TaxID=2910230 RepID=UPI003D0BA97F